MQILQRILCGGMSVAATGALFACASTSVSPSSVMAIGGYAQGLAPPAGPVSSSEEIAGEWDIVRFAGHEPKRLEGTGRAAFADFGEDGVGLRIECNHSGASGRIVNGRFVPDPGDACEQTAMGCGPEREARERALFGFFDRGPTVERLAEGRLRLLAGDTELLLERPERRRLAYLPRVQELLGEWRLAEITRYHAGGGYSGIGLTEITGELSFDGISASFAACPQYAIRYRYTPEGRIEKLAGPRLPPNQMGCAALKGEWGRRDMPVPWDVLRVLHGNPLAERVDENTILLSTEEHGLLLTRAE